jgi:hypothetical protein
VVEHVYFRGKDLGYRIYVHPSDTPRLLPSKVQVDLSERDRRILASIRSLKSGNYRREALAALSCTDSDLDRLAGLGLLKRTKSGATSITTEGRNASSGFND